MTTRRHKRKEPPGLHNHDERAFVSRRVTTIGSTSHLSQTKQPIPISQELHEARYTIPPEEDGHYEVELDDSLGFPRIRGNPEILSGDVPGIQVITKVKAKRYKNSDVPLLQWMGYRDEYLDTLMGMDGPGWSQHRCAGCAEVPLYRCKDCTHGPMWCQNCLVIRHRQSPLHVIEKWTGSYFARSSLRVLGLRVQLGHRPGQPCSAFKAGSKDFVVIHTNGIHNIHLEFCRCRAVPRHVQLLQIGWYPATPLKPQTCATMDVLRFFQTLNLQGKTSGHGFYRSLVYLTDNTGLHPPPDRLESFMLMAREWRHLKMVKRAGRAYDPGGIRSTLPGSLAVPCRACPNPAMNLPPDWDSDDVPAQKRLLYMLILAMDANFRLRSKLRGPVSDPVLNPGWAYFIDYVPYSEFVAKYVDEEEISTCVGFQALLNMLTKKSKGLRATGVGGVSCARHQMFRPLGMGDLQKGERQCNMDYILTSAIMGVSLLMLMIPYDVACQWFLKFFQRLGFLPATLQLIPPLVIPVVPKFHLQSHEEKCHSEFSFNFAPGTGRTDGEGCERNWAELVGQGPATAEMLPGHRWETLDDCCGWANWRKAMGLGNLLLKHMLLAIPQAIRTHNDFRRFNSRLLQSDPLELEAMEQELAEWVLDKKKTDPYRLPHATVTMDEIKLVLAEEAKERVEQGLGSLHQGVTPSAFLFLGLLIENLQQALRVDIKGLRRQTLLQTTTVVERRTTLLKRFKRFRELQRVHMPGFDPAQHEPDPAPINVEDFILHMPSQLTKARVRRFCPHGIAELEDRIQFAQATDALESVRHHLRTRSFANQFKIANVTGQIQNTRAREAQARIDDKVRAATDEYRRARVALIKLRGPGNWETILQALNKGDVRALNERELTQQEEDAAQRIHQENPKLT